MDTSLQDRFVYLERMAKPLQEKLRVTEFIPANASCILDVGCADGAVTITMAKLYPHIQFHGIDLDEDFLRQARETAAEEGVQNVQFECLYLRDLLVREQRYDSVTFISVLHEFYSYGEGISSVLKALADAEELLVSGGDIVIRDMILFEYTKRTNFLTHSIVEKIAATPERAKQVEDFSKFFGPLQSTYAINHFLLKYMYTENWERECQEHYVPVTFEQYVRCFELLGMELVLQDQHLISYLREKWVADFGLSQNEIDPLKSTGFLVARKS